MSYPKLYKVILSFSCLFIYASSFSQLTVSTNHTAAILAAKLAGPGITISSPVLTCAAAANGTFISLSTPLTIDSGIILTSGSAASAAGFESTLASTNNGTAGDASLTSLAMAATHDACVLEFDFTPNGDTVSFNYQFGSEEYNNSTCGQYNDAFAFFISGPGISGTQNMALVPGTNIPVTVNSINNGIPGPSGYPGYCNISNCTGMGPGSPFTTDYYDNTGGTQLTYKGYTKKLAAIHDVIPCNTYHLKIAIADASNNLYDSGVFIEAGSLKTNSFTFNRADSIGTTINGVPNTIVRGCAPARVSILSGNTLPAPQTVHLTFGGTAIRGVDYTAPDSATIAAGTDSIAITIAGLIASSPAAKTLELYLSSSLSCGIADSITLHIIDTPTAAIITADTTICNGTSVQIQAGGTSGLTYSWTPPAGLNNPSVMQPIASPAVTTTYIMTALFPGAGCPAINKSITVTVTQISVSILTPDTTVCLGASVNILVNGNPSYTYSWLPGAGLSNAATEDPLATPNGITTYSLTATSPSGCKAYAQITITVAPANAVILTPDTTICIGASVPIRVSGDPSLNYSWSPANGLDDPNIMQPVATPSVSTTYFMAATVTGSVCRADGSITIRIESVSANAGPDESICLNAPIPLKAARTGTNYSYLWTGPGGYSSIEQEPVINNAQLANQGIYTLLVTDNTTGCFAADTTTINVVPGSILTNITPNQTIVYGSSIQLNADNAVSYMWTPNNGTLNNNNINDPVAIPLATTTYTVYGYDANGCLDSASVTIHVTYDTIFIPNAFTPNGDGLNDIFRIGNLGYYRLVEMSVYNRWGALVYHAADCDNKGWDGTYNGVPQDLGTFNYQIIIGHPNGELHSFKGDITLIR